MKFSHFSHLSNYRNFYFVGIGGIGMSSLASYLHKKGVNISGCDGDLFQKSIYQLQDEKVEIHAENECENYLKKNTPDILVFTNNVPENHPAYLYARTHSLFCITRAQLLGMIVNPMKTIGITGSHGKTSTTAMIATIFLESSFDPTIFVGGFMQSIKSNIRTGNSEYAIVEADDAYRSFLTLTPHTAIITTVGFEHLETYKNWDDIYETFTHYLNNTLPDGNIIVNYDCPHAKLCAEQSKRNHFSYGTKKEYKFSAQNIIAMPHSSSYEIYEEKIKKGVVNVPLPGIHMVYNSVAAYAAARCYGISPEQACDGLSKYKGVERRFEQCGTYKTCPVIDDYGHHPTEINYVLGAARARCKGRLIVFFQPHKYSRTHHLWNEFITVLSAHKVDQLYITDIFPAGETECIENHSAYNLAKEVSSKTVSCEHVPFNDNFEILFEKINLIKTPLTSEDIILCLGAGKLDKFASFLCSKK